MKITMVIDFWFLISIGDISCLNPKLQFWFHLETRRFFISIELNSYSLLSFWFFWFFISVDSNFLKLLWYCSDSSSFTMQLWVFKWLIDFIFFIYRGRLCNAEESGSRNQPTAAYMVFEHFIATIRFCLRYSFFLFEYTLVLFAILKMLSLLYKFSH